MTSDARRDQFLHAYDTQLRGAAEAAHAASAQRHGPLWWCHHAWGGFVTYQSLAGHDVDQLIAETVAHYRDATAETDVEWKSRGHDEPADLDRRLRAQGFEPDEVETVMIGAATDLVAAGDDPGGVTVRRAGVGGDIHGDTVAAMALQAEVFGHGAGDVEGMLECLRDPSGTTQLWLAEADGQVVAAGRLELVPGTQFGGLWGGAAREQYRGRGIYRALTAARAQAALQLGYTLLQSDCTAMSRPILQRAGLVAVTTTTPYQWHRPGTPSGMS